MANFGEYRLFNRYFDRNKPVVDWDWNDVVNRMPFTKPIKHKTAGKYWYCDPPAMPYPWTGYPSLNQRNGAGPIDGTCFIEIIIHTSGTVGRFNKTSP